MGRDSERKAGWLILLFLLVLSLASLHSGCAGAASSGSPGGPTVSISSPTSGATLSGTTPVTASASSTVGIAGVQFLLNGVNLGGEVTTTPYSLPWDTTGTSNGSHMLAARARDTGGTVATSMAVSVTVSNASGGSGFQTRCNAPGVVLCNGFDTPADIAGSWGNNKGTFPSLEADGRRPVIDTILAASGAGSLKFTVNAHSAGDPGSFFTNFSPDLLTQFDAGQEFYVQWRQRFSPEFLANAYTGGNGWKQVIIGKGDRAGVCDPTNPTSATCSTSCSEFEVAVQQGVYSPNAKIPQMYHSCGAKLVAPGSVQYELFTEPIPPAGINFYLQDAIRNPGCFYNGSNPSIPPCVGYKPNQWMTFQVHIKIGTWYLNDFVFHHESIVQMWVAEEGQPSTLVFDLRPQVSPDTCHLANPGTSMPMCQTGYDLVRVNDTQGKYGKIWLIPYNHGQDPTPTYPVAYTWYDELIISRQRIPDAR